MMMVLTDNITVMIPAHLSPNMMPALLARMWMGVSRFRTAAAKLRTLSILKY